MRSSNLRRVRVHFQKPGRGKRAYSRRIRAPRQVEAAWVTVELLLYIDSFIVKILVGLKGPIPAGFGPPARRNLSVERESTLGETSARRVISSVVR